MVNFEKCTKFYDQDVFFLVKHDLLLVIVLVFGKLNSRSEGKGQNQKEILKRAHEIKVWKLIYSFLILNIL